MEDPDILVAGDALVDFLPSTHGPPTAEVSYVPRPGGSAANVAVALDRLGVSPLFWTRFATDDFGSFLRDTFEECDIPAKYFVTDDEGKTTLAVVSHDVDGERSFTFHRDRGADTRLEPEMVTDDTLDTVSWVYTTGVTMSVEPSRTATKELQRRANSDCTVSLDPNWRSGLWERREEFSSVIRGALEHVDVVTASPKDLDAADFHASEPIELARQVADRGPHTVVVTLGAEGAVCFGSEASPIPGVARHQGYDVDVVDTTGAGDGFLAGLIAALTHDVDDGERALALANAVGAVVTTRPGAVSALDSIESVRRFHDNVPWR